MDIAASAIDLHQLEAMRVAASDTGHDHFHGQHITHTETVGLQPRRPRRRAPWSAALATAAHAQRAKSTVKLTGAPCLFVHIQQ